MIVIKKKKILQELALSLFLLLECEKNSAARSISKHIRERSEEALIAAAVYTGVFGEPDVQHFLKSKHFKFTIECGKDIVKGDIIRFIEGVFNNRQKPARLIGKRGVTAEVTDIRTTGKSPMLHMRVIASGGVWELSPETPISRTLRNVTHFEAMRVAWDDESKRNPAHDEPKPETKPEPEEPKEVLPEVAKKVTAQMFGRYESLRPTKPNY